MLSIPFIHPRPSRLIAIIRLVVWLRIAYLEGHLSQRSPGIASESHRRKTLPRDRERSGGGLEQRIPGRGGFHLEVEYGGGQGRFKKRRVFSVAQASKGGAVGGAESVGTR